MGSLAVDRQPPSNRQIADAWLDHLRDAKRRAPMTIYQYAGKLDELFEYAAGKPLGFLTVDDLEAWLQRPRRGRAHGEKGQAATLQKEVAILRGLWKFAVARGFLHTDPTVLLHAPAPKNRMPKPIDDALWIRTWDKMDDPQAILTLGLGFFCGLRRAEIAALTADHVDGGRLVGFVRKGGGDDVLEWAELVSLYEDALPHLTRANISPFRELLCSARHGTGGFLVDLRGQGGINDPQAIYRRFTKWGVAGFTPHQLRHSFVTNLLKIGVPIHLVSVLANHSEPRGGILETGQQFAGPLVKIRRTEPQRRNMPDRHLPVRERSTELRMVQIHIRQVVRTEIVRPLVRRNVFCQSQGLPPGTEGRPR